MVNANHGWTLHPFSQGFRRVCSIANLTGPLHLESSCLWCHGVGNRDGKAQTHRHSIKDAHQDVHRVIK